MFLEPCVVFSRNEHCWQMLLVFWGKKVTSQSNISFLFNWLFFNYTGKLNYSEQSFVLEIHRTLLPNFEPSLSHRISFFKSKEEGNTKSHWGEGSICLSWHERSFFRMHLQLEVSSLWAFCVLYWLLLSCRKAFQGFECRHPVCVCASHPKSAQRHCSFALPGQGLQHNSLWLLQGPLGTWRGFPGVWVCTAQASPELSYLHVLESCLALPPRSDAAIPIGSEGQDVRAGFINPLRVQLLVGSWEWEVFVCPKNSYPEGRIIKAAPFGSVSKMASSSGYSW